ncbi:hypothetical protein L6164_028860 [Bauhinia variegata]|uniref:Uncharacterized protein n=1 Tax=Bauhinia variegata TaxID=167791 RepID=A0ACB9L7U2_BAUVA|nr:hypothetical protein L6164_028860 [Bauhinia variegata]
MYEVAIRHVLISSIYTSIDPHASSRKLSNIAYKCLSDSFLRKSLKFNSSSMECFNENFSEPLSPMAQNFSSSALRVYILGVFEFDVPIDELQIVSVLSDLFLSTNP